MTKQKEQHQELDAPPGTSLAPKSLSKSPDSLLHPSSGITTVNINGPLNVAYGGRGDTYNWNINGGFVGGRRNRNTFNPTSLLFSIEVATLVVGMAGVAALMMVLRR